jgi:rhodanese-related sulfurtransferase
VTDFSGLADIIGDDNLIVLDVRQHGEFDDSHIPGALNIPLHELADRISEVPCGEVWVHCASGYRSSIAASVLDRPGRTVVLINDDFDTAEKLNLTR